MNGLYTARITIWRMQCVSELVRSKTPFTIKSLAREIEVGERTLRRDMDFMRNFLGYNFEFDSKLRTEQFPAGYWRGNPPKKRIL
jgi:hypothetical protein